MRAKSFIILAFSFIFIGAAGTSYGASQNFKAWLKDLRAEAVSRGVSERVVRAELPDTLKPLPRVLELDRAQPEGSPDFARYIRNAVTEQRVETGRAKVEAQQKLLAGIEKTYGVDKEVIAALWGIETNYGSNTGGFDTVQALATLAYDGRRGAYFREELIKALQILQEGHVSRARMKGSWAGAMGQNQFMPSSFFRFAVDYNKDGRRDIWRTDADVFASTANYLAESGWQRGEPWGMRVRLPAGFDPGMLGIDTMRTLQYWHDKGVRLQDGKAIPFQGEYQASIIQPGGSGTAAYIVYENFRVIMKWNRSVYFATAVGLLSDRLKSHEVAQTDLSKKG